MTRRLGIMALVGLCMVPRISAAVAESNDAILSQFFSIWDNNARVTSKAVQALYADRVVYYGRSMTAEQVFENKRAFTQRWPSRHYAVVPGTSLETCDSAKAHCHVGVTLAWHAESTARRSSARGWTRVSFDLVREGGALKIARESGRPARTPE